jgi:hypothetical protein
MAKMTHLVKEAVRAFGQQGSALHLESCELKQVTELGEGVQLE